jgi:cephalosporin-C deacetylase
MRLTRLCTIVFLFSISLVSAQNLLNPEWKFKTGDDASWSTPQLNDSDWKTIQAGELWETQGYGAYDGFAWYRTSAIIPSSLKEKAQKYGGLLLNLCRIDDADETFFNGQHIGQTGKFPPDYEGKYNILREYAIPQASIRWDQPNYIAVRVYDFSGGGGIYDGKPELRVKGLADLFTVKLQFKYPNHIYPANEPVVVTAVLANDSDEPLDGSIALDLKSDFRESIASQNDKIKMGKHSHKTHSFQIKSIVPGFYRGSVTFSSLLNNNSVKFGLGVAPEQVISPPDSPADLADYWQRAKKELAAVEPQFKIIKKDSLCTATNNIYLVEMRSLGNVLIRGWYSVPVQPGVYPAILHVQGYSSNMQPGSIYQGPDFVSFGLNIRGHGNSRDNINPGFPGYLLNQLPDKEMYIYRGAYMDCVRAVDFLVSRPEVDKSRIVVEGGSQGGALSFATAALNNDRIRLCVPHVPFLSDFRDYFKIAAWPASEYEKWVAEHPQVGWDNVYATLSYIDIKNLAPWIKAPVIMTIGLVDDTCPPHTNFAAYNNLTVPREYHVYPESGHGLPSEYYDLKTKWIKERMAK